MGLVQRKVGYVSMTHPAFGNNVVGNAPHIGDTSLKHCNFHATFLIEMHVQRLLCEVVVLVEIACEALRQFARSVVVNMDQSRHTRMGSADLYGCLLEAGAGEVADRLTGTNKTRSGRIYRIVRATTSAPSPSISGTGEHKAMHETRRRRKSSPEASIEDEIAQLRDLDLKRLRARWQSIFLRSPPPHLPRHLLFAVLAFQIQADRLGDFDHETRKTLDRSHANESGWRWRTG
jgi:hypothetical protein